MLYSYYIYDSYALIYSTRLQDLMLVVGKRYVVH